MNFRGEHDTKVAGKMSKKLSIAFLKIVVGSSELSKHPGFFFLTNQVKICDGPYPGEKKSDAILQEKS